MGNRVLLYFKGTMILKIAYLYFSYLAWGCLTLLPVVKLQEVGQGFYRFFGFSCVALQTLAIGLALLAGLTEEAGFRTAVWTLGFSLFFTLCFTVALRIRVRWFLWSCFWLAVLSGAVAIGYFPWRGEGHFPWHDLYDPGRSFFHALSSSLLLGAGILAMMLGHWYLVTPKLSIAPLKRYTTIYILLTVLTGLKLGLSYVLEGNTESLDMLWLESTFVLFRVVWGFLTPLGLAYWIWKTVRMKSTQSATGILYASMVCTMIGEAFGLYLTFRTGVLF